ncbi:MAG: JAB domain-containing protein [Candidatus Sphingomonas phytovorans]|nr:JAB domain-containing protein [Sphingomonas sp.]WEJ98350.1 MAG: JAB domain-containing protein [Sphingomonas sp.]
MAAPAAPSALRCRQILEGFLEPVAGAGAAGLSARLVEEFGSLPGVLAASGQARLRVLEGRPDLDALLGGLDAALAHIATLRFARGPVVDSWPALLDYLRLTHAFSAVEIARVLHLDGQGRLILDEEISRGTIDEATIHVREVIRRAVELHAASIVLVHNHPSGDPAPSRADVDITRRIARAGQPLGIAVHDHLIMSTSGHASMRELGLI